MEKLTLAEIMAETLFVVKYYGYREVLKGSELHMAHKRDDVRDIDLLVIEQQPERLQPFLQAMASHEKWITIPEFWKIWEKMEG